MNFTTAQQIIYGAVMANEEEKITEDDAFELAQEIQYGRAVVTSRDVLYWKNRTVDTPDPIPGYDREFNDRAQRDSDIDSRALKICDEMMHEMDPTIVQAVLDHVVNTDELYTALADAFRAGRKPQATQMLWDWIENEMWDRAVTKATREIDEGY